VIFPVQVITGYNNRLLNNNLFYVIFAVMGKILYAIALMFIVLTSCERGGEDNKELLSGSATINNTLTFDAGTQSYNLYGFSFSEGALVSILTGSDYITVGCSDSVVNIQTDSYTNSFFLYGEYGDATQAENGFNGLLATSVATWEEWAHPVAGNQVWLFRTGEKNYAKFWVKNITITESNKVECTFEWAYQPNGTLTFPEK